MRRRDAVLARLTQVVDIIGDLANEFVFLGGSVTPLLVTNPGAADARNTKDIDAIVQVTKRSSFHQVEERLASMNFHLDPQEDVMCRYKNGDLILDVMPSDPKVLLFGNSWYGLAFESPLTYELPNQKSISIINAPLFICTKFVAFKDRGAADQKDLEDIVALVDGRFELLRELEGSSAEVRSWISMCAQELLASDFPQKIDWFLPQDVASGSRAKLVIERFAEMTKLNSDA